MARPLVSAEWRGTLLQITIKDSPSSYICVATNAPLGVGMILIRKAAIAAAVLLLVFVAGCGDTFRPIVLPVIQPGGDPQSNRNAIVLSNAGTTAVGTTTHINASGDTNVG